MKKTEKELEEMGIYSERNYYSAVTVLCCGLGAGVCIALSLLVEYLTGRAFWVKGFPFASNQNAFKGHFCPFKRQ
jgi:hypothetical protein